MVKGIKMTEQKLVKFTRLLKKKHSELRIWAKSNGISCYRVYNKDMGDLPFSIDIYDKYLHIVQYEQKGVASLSQRDALRLADAAGKSLYFPEDRIFLKYRTKLNEGEQYQKYSAENITAVIQEFGLNFKVNLSDYIDTGLFLDHRDTRALVRQNAAGRKVLNLFSYTGSFSVYAAAGGAVSTTTVDLSNVYLNWAKENMELNHFKSAAHTFVSSDVFKYLDEAISQKEKYDLIVLDPPTFSNSRKMDKKLDIQKDHVELINKSLSLLSKRGFILFSTNYTDFKIDLKVRDKGFVTNITDETIPEDFKGSKIHKCWHIEKRK